MLSRSDIEHIAETLTRGNAGHAETLYLQDLVLSTVSRETADEMVFKGGTALLKFYQLDRFSGDLDFTLTEPLDITALVDRSVRDLENYGATVTERTDDETDTTFNARLGIQGPLYTGDRRSLGFVRIEVNKRSSAHHVRTLRYTPHFRDIPAFELVVLDETEILAEKIRALMTRRQPRDLYDVYHLLGKSVAVNPALVQEKLDYYDLEYRPGTVIERAEELEDGWDNLRALTYSETPPFVDALAALERGLTGSNPAE